MRSLVLHLHGPMQSWGGDSRLNTRSTERFPTKSALVGILAAALGLHRGESVESLAALSLTIRIDRNGQIIKDYHTVGGGYPKGQRLKTAKGKGEEERTEETATLVSERYYLADAAFTVALSGDDETITLCNESLQHPQWALSLGRRSCPPAEPFFLGVIDDDPVIYLQDVLPVVRDVKRKKDRSVAFIIDDPTGEALSVGDVPQEALNEWSSYGKRNVRRLTRELEEERFVTDPLMLVERSKLSDV